MKSFREFVNIKLINEVKLTKNNVKTYFRVYRDEKLDDVGAKDSLKEVSKIFDAFNKRQASLRKKDIFGYNNEAELMSALKKIPNALSDIGDSELILDDEDVLMYHVKSHEGAVRLAHGKDAGCYGKWCIAHEKLGRDGFPMGVQFFKDYNEDSDIFFVLNKEDGDKDAIVRDRETGVFTIFDKNDDTPNRYLFQLKYPSIAKHFGESLKDFEISETDMDGIIKIKSGEYNDVEYRAINEYVYINDREGRIANETELDGKYSIERKLHDIDNGNKYDEYVWYNEQGEAYKHAADEQGTTLTRWEDQGTKVEVMYLASGAIGSRLSSLIAGSDGDGTKFHSIDDEPANHEYASRNGDVHSSWYKNGLLHRDGGRPSAIYLDNVSGVEEMSWKKNGNFYRDGDKPTKVITYHMDGYSELQWHGPDNKVIRRETENL